ncbi:MULTISPECIES: glycosyltransferase family 2 protein [Providencia]|uniref:glycosyltransferase family 2 protein n=1 Tax=Providencia TaxID=586 RepID=UPI000E3C7161|nr:MULTISPECIES: glycosyltransferase family 2 protein [unclassified Providencia]RFT08656.1 glycosyltransferase family 2 protein [Providencia rettgeri]
MKNTKLVSIIVPMYNVEAFIGKCIYSIIGQTYKNIEIILIDDGSPDKSGSIAEEISLTDQRIKVIHTKNRGVSHARNLGIEQSKGEYLVFVDGDDYLSSDYVEYMMSLAINTGAEFTMSKNCQLFPNSQIYSDELIDNVEVWSPEKAASELLYPGKIEIGCWNKLFLKAFIINNNITFPEKLYMGEGLNFIVTAAQKANKVCVGSKKVYNYRKDNQQSATTVVNIPKYINALRAIDNIDQNKILKSKIIDLSIIYHKYITTYLALHTIYITGERELYSKEVKEYISYLRKHYYYFIFGHFSLADKIKITFFSISPAFAVNSISLIKKFGVKNDN